MKTMHEDVFYAHFQPYRHPNTKTDIWGGIGIETYGEDFELIKSLDEEFVWTVMDGDENEQIIVPGLHFVNRICYLVTKVSHQDQQLEFRLSDKSLTDIGIKRQSTMLIKYFAKLSDNENKGTAICLP